MATVVMLGAGMMGSALCVPLLDAGHTVQLVGTHLDGEIVAALRAGEPHPTLRYPLPAGIEAFPLEALPAVLPQADALALGVSSAGVRWAAGVVGGLLRPGTPVFMISKGLEFDGRRLSVLPEVFREALPEGQQAATHPVGVVGPCIAGELARRVPTCVVFAGSSQAPLDSLAALARTPYYHVRCSTDGVGMEACAALKNAFALAVGFGAGLHERAGGQRGQSVAWHNYEAALFAQSAREMQRWVTLAGGDPASVVGLAGVGDLQVTCQGGRTGRLGRWLGLGLSLPEAVEQMQGATLECLDVLAVLDRALAVFQSSGRVAPTELPLTRHLCDVALRGHPVDVPLSTFG